MDYDTVSARDFGHSLQGISVNLLVRDVLAAAASLTVVIGMTAHRVSADFAIVLHGGQPLQLHSDGSFLANPCTACCPRRASDGLE